MADTKTSLLPSASALAGSELVPVVQGGVTSQTTVSAIRTGYAPLANPTFTGTVTVPTQAPGDNSTKAASTAYADLKANLASPTFTGTPAVPTATPLTNNTQAASTAYADGAASLSSIVSFSAAKTLALTDAGTTQYHPSADTTARILTIPANASVAFPIGTVIAVDNDIGAGTLTIAITTDTLVLIGAAGSTGSRTLVAGGKAVAQKVTATRWRISGTAELT